MDKASQPGTDPSRTAFSGSGDLLILALLDDKEKLLPLLQTMY